MALEKKEFMIAGYKDKEGVVGEHMYIFEKLPAKKGLEVQLKLMEGEINPDLIQDVICSCVYLGSNKFSAAKFDDHFSGKYGHLMNVYNAVIEYNFDENFTEEGTVED